MRSFPALAGKLPPLGEVSDWRGLHDPGSAQARIPDRRRADRIGRDRALVSRDTAAPTGATRLGLLRVVPTGSRPGVRKVFERAGFAGAGSRILPRKIPSRSESGRSNLRLRWRASSESAPGAWRHNPAWLGILSHAILRGRCAAAAAHENRACRRVQSQTLPCVERPAQGGALPARSHGTRDTPAAGHASGPPHPGWDLGGPLCGLGQHNFGAYCRMRARLEVKARAGLAAAGGRGRRRRRV
jgi:hypothetical protein